MAAIGTIARDLTKRFGNASNRATSHSWTLKFARFLRSDCKLYDQYWWVNHNQTFAPDVEKAIYGLPSAKRT